MPREAGQGRPGGERLSGRQRRRGFFGGLLLCAAALAVCGCSSSSTTSYTIGGAVSGLTGGGLVLTNYGSNLTVNANGSFTFPSPVAAGGPNAGVYNVTVVTQPTNPPQTCEVANGSGTATADVGDIAVICAVETFTIGGNVSGLTGTGLQLQLNGGSTLPVNANGGFTFSTQLPVRGGYNVTVSAEPTGPAQTCVVSNGIGTVTTNVTNVQVTCTIAAFTVGGVAVNLAGTGGGLQLQLNGGNTLPVNGNGEFIFPGTILNGTAYSVTVSTQPTAQTCFVTNGTGTAVANVTSVVVNCGTSNWTWQSGSNTVGQKGTDSSPGTPGARDGAVRWTDNAGNFWMFGGNGLDSNGNSGALSDLWEFTGGHWNFISESGTEGTKGTYGSPGTPGGRSGAVSWTDAGGHFWMFGGLGYDSAGSFGFLSDLWEYTGTQWNFIGGATVVNQKGTYGQMGQAASTNIPGGRDGAVGWVEGGNFWLFGGNGEDSRGAAGGGTGLLNDLWELSGGGTGSWTWVNGSNEIDEPGVYTAAPIDNFPGARQFAVGWADTAGNLWLFGGNGYDVVGNSGYLNDVWEFSGGIWTWKAGADVANQAGSYGFTGFPASGNTPGGRDLATGWADSSGHFWLSSGLGYDANGAFGDLNDLWEFSAGEWTWQSGSNVNGQKGSYGVLGTATAGNVPGARQQAVEWNDTLGHFWIFGGSGFDSTGAQGFLNDLWEYIPTP